MALGVETAGTVTAVGSAVTTFGIGDEVLTHCVPFREQGAWAEQVICAAADCAGKPPSLGWADAAVFPIPALTAAQVLDDALAVQAGETMLVHGAGGLTGKLIVQMAAVRGAQVIATAGPALADRGRAAGAMEVLDYHDAHWPELVLRLTVGVGAAAAANAARGGAAQAFQAVETGGRLATITSDSVDADREVAVQQAYVRSDGPRLAALAELLSRGELTMDVGAVYRLARAADALVLATSGGHGQAVVVSPAPL